MNNILGIDIGGQGIKFRYEDKEGKVFTRNCRLGKVTLTQLKEAITQFLKENKIVNVNVFGISQTGIVTDNCLIRSTNQPYLEGMNGDSFQDIGIKKAFILNDGRAMAVTAYKKYSAKNVFAIVAGTGIGSGMIIDGKIIVGRNYKAGEIHCIPIETGEGICRLGNLCSGSAIIKKFGYNYMKEHLEEKEVQDEIKKAGRYMGLYIIMAKQFLDPEVIYLTGGGTTFDGYFEAATEYVKEHLPNIEKDHTKIVKSEDPFFDGCIGAEWYAYLQMQS